MLYQIMTPSAYRLEDKNVLLTQQCPLFLWCQTNTNVKDESGLIRYIMKNISQSYQMQGYIR